jgi:hypothetical protein
VIAVYDFSTVEDTFNASSSTVTIKITPGIKFIPDRTVLLVWKTIMDEWEQIRRLAENKSWADAVRSSFWSIGNSPGSYRPYFVKVGLYDEYGDLLKEADAGQDLKFSYSTVSHPYRSPEILAQHKYFENQKFREITFNGIPLKDITDKLMPRITTGIRIGGRETDGPVLTTEEWQEWLASRRGTGN